MTIKLHCLFQLIPFIVLSVVNNEIEEISIRLKSTFFDAADLVCKLLYFYAKTRKNIGAIMDFLNADHL